MPAQYPGHPLLSAALVWTKALLPDARPTRTFVQRRLGSQGDMGRPLESVIRQSCRVLDCEPLVAVAGRSEKRLYADLGRVDGALTLVCDPTVAECSSMEQRFLVFRAIYAHVQRHNTLHALAQALNGERLRSLLSLFYGWNQRNSVPILPQDWNGHEPGLTCPRSLNAWLTGLAAKYPTQAVADLTELCCERRPFEAVLNEHAARFAGQACERGVAESVLARM